MKVFLKYLTAVVAMAFVLQLYGCLPSDESAYTVTHTANITGHTIKIEFAYDVTRLPCSVNSDQATCANTNTDEKQLCEGYKDLKECRKAYWTTQFNTNEYSALSANGDSVSTKEAVKCKPKDSDYGSSKVVCTIKLDEDAAKGLGGKIVLDAAAVTMCEKVNDCMYAHYQSPPLTIPAAEGESSEEGSEGSEGGSPVLSDGSKNKLAGAYCAANPNVPACKTTPDYCNSDPQGTGCDLDGDGVFGNLDACPLEPEVFSTGRVPADGVLDGCPNSQTASADASANGTVSLLGGGQSKGACSMVSATTHDMTVVLSAFLLFVATLISVLSYRLAVNLVYNRSRRRNFIQ
jgi:hypothetical protein